MVQQSMSPTGSSLNQSDGVALLRMTIIVLSCILMVYGGRRYFGIRVVDADDVRPRQLAYRVDVNQCEIAELAALPGIGPTLARRIVEARKKRGGFDHAEQLLEINGIGEKTINEIKPYLVFGEYLGSGLEAVNDIVPLPWADLRCIGEISQEGIREFST